MNEEDFNIITKKKKGLLASKAVERVLGSQNFS